MNPGFADPVAEAQSCFRALLDATARPGQPHCVGAGLQPPEPLAPATAAALLTLLDEAAPLWLGEEMADAWPWLAFHCGVRPAEPDCAAFACSLDLPEFSRFNLGSDAAPQDSTTLILQVAAIGVGPAYEVRGPGLREPGTLRVTGLPTGFAARWAANHALFPRGVDLILCAGHELCALPRSVQIKGA